MIPIALSTQGLRLERRDDTVRIFDPLRRLWVKLLPEEWVRQWLIHHFIEVMEYPRHTMAVEKRLPGHLRSRRFDLLVFDRSLQPWMLVECKSPEQKINADTLYQLLDYHRHLPARYWLLTNGISTFCADARDPESIRWLDQLPSYDH